MSTELLNRPRPSMRPRLRGGNLVFLHGQPGSSADWDAVVAALPPTMHALALDRPGYGHNRRRADTIDANVTWLLNRIALAGLDDVVLVGHSYGGGVALAAAARAPQRVRALVLLAGVGPGCVTGWDRLLAAPLAGPALSMAAWSALPWLARRSPLRSGKTAASCQTLGQLHADADPLWRSVLTEQRELVRTAGRWDGLAAEITTPTMIIADPGDRVVPISTAHALHGRLPNSRLVLVDHGGHQLPLRIPDVIATQIGHFVDSLD